MGKILEAAYEEFSSIAGSALSHEAKMTEMFNLYDRLGDASCMFDNMIYGRLGMSADDILDMFDMEDVLPCDKKHMLFY